MTTTLERLDARRLTYRFDLGADVPWARADEPGLFVPDRLLARLGFDVDALKGAPEARASLDRLFALVTAQRFCDLERDVVEFVREEGARHPSESASHLVSEEQKHIALFERLAAELAARHPEEARALAQAITPPPAFAHLRERAAHYASPDELAYAFWLHTLFFEEYTIFLQHALEEPGSGAVQPLWLAAHRVHRQEELQHVLTDAAYLELLPLADDARRRMAKALWVFLDDRFDALFGLDACTRALAALHPHVAPRRERRLSALPLLEDVLTHPAFRRTREAAPWLLELGAAGAPSSREGAPPGAPQKPAHPDGRLDGGAPACALADDDTITARLLARGVSDARVTFIDPDGAESAHSYASLIAQARAHLAALSATGARPGDAVVILTVLPRETVPWLWACLLGGLRAAPLALPAADADSEEARRLLRIARLLGTQARAPWVIVDDALAPLVTEALATDAEAARARVMHASAVGPERDAALHTPRADDVAIVQFSSGSLGDPRGVLLTHRNLLANATAMLAARGGATRETFVSWLPLFHDMGLIGYHLTPLVADADQVLLPPLRFVRDPLSWLRALSQHKATVTGAPHFALARLLPLLTHDVVRALDLSALHTFLVGAEPLAIRTLTAFSRALAPAGLRHDAVCPAYGLAEATLAVTMAPRGDAARALFVKRGSLDHARGITVTHAEEDDALALVDCGAPIPGVKVRVVDERGAPCAERTTGTIVIAGPTVSAGYHGDATPAPADRWLDTGDLGLIADGRLYVTGRKKDVFFVAGRNHYANDVEAVVRELSFVHPGAVGLAVEWDPGFGVDALALFVALRADALTSEGIDERTALERVHGHVQRRLGLAVDRVVAIDKRDVPRTSSGKLKRRALLDRLRGGAFSGAASFVRPSARTHAATIGAPVHPAPVSAQPLGDVLDVVRATWAAVLECAPERVTADASFRALGGDSFRAIQVHDRLERHYRIALPPDLLVIGITPAHMARFVAPRLTAEHTHAPSADPARPHADTRTPPPPRATRGARLGTRDADDEDRDEDRDDGDDVVIVSLALRVPGAQSANALWRMLRDGASAFADAPPLRRLIEGPRRGAWLEHIDRFDPSPFSLSDDEATAMGPAQRLVLEVAFEALAGTALSSRRVGVFVGAGDDGTHLRYVHDPSLLSRHSLLGALTNLIAARAARTFNLTGPALVVDTACSSSLTAVHLACQSLRAHECDAALAGGAQVGLTGALVGSFERAGLLSSSGVARPFDDDADGLVPGEGVALLVFKRRADAERDRDHVLATVRGSALNNDGGALSGTAPSPQGQRDVVLRAWQSAGLPPWSAALFEAHAAGTAFGDAVEARVLAELCADGAPRALGSIKGNLGHTLSAAGALGLIKVVLALAHGAAPPTPGLVHPSRRVDFAAGGLIPVLGAPRPLPRTVNDAPLVAGVSAFGLGGTNVHVVIEGARAPEPLRSPSAPDAPFVVSLGAPGDGHGALAAHARALGERLRAEPDAAPELIAAANGYAELLPERRAFVAASAREAADALDALTRETTTRAHPRGKVAFVLPGPGSQRPGMGRALYAREPVFRDALDACAQVCGAHDVDVRALLFADDERPSAPLHRLAHAQPAVFAYGYSLARLWNHRGISPALLLGHSAGELLAVHLAGVLSFEDALTLVLARGRAMADAAPGRMAAVLLEADAVRRALAAHPGVTIAAHNAPAQVVVSGSEDDVRRAVRALEQDGVSVRLLDVDCAAHSDALARAEGPFARALAAARFQPPRAGAPTVISTVAGAGARATFDAPHFRAHLTARVDFVSAVQRARALGADTFLELGATAGLTTCVRQIVDAEPASGGASGADAPLLVACGARGEPEELTLAHATAALINAGLPVRVSTLSSRSASSHAACGALPADALPVQWQRRRLWAEPRRTPAFEADGPSLADEPAVRDHVTAGIPTAPAALLVDRALDALSRAHGPVDLVDVVVERPLPAGPDQPRAALSLVIDEGSNAEAADARAVRVRTRASDAVHLSARHEPARGRTHTSLDLDALRARMTTIVHGADIYARLDRTGFVMGPSMRAVERVLRGERELLATLRAPAGASRGRLVDPALLDGASHAVAAFFLDAPGAQMFLGFSIEAVRVFQGIHDACLAYVRLKSAFKENSPTLRYDIALTNEAGEVLGEVEDFAARRVEMRGADEHARLTGVTVPPMTRPPTTLPPTTLPPTTLPPTTLPPTTLAPTRADTAPRASDDEGPRARLVLLLRRMVAERLRRPPDAIPEHGPLARLGVDSLLAVELVRKLEARLGIKLHATLLFEAPTVAAVVDRVLRLSRERGVTLALDEDPP